MRRALLIVLLAFVSCARLLPADRRPPEDAHDEIAGLQQRIATLRDSSQMESAPASDRCRRMGAAADEICRCADRICVLADSLDDAPARRACMQSREDCKRARANAAACK